MNADGRKIPEHHVSIVSSTRKHEAHVISLPLHPSQLPCDWPVLFL